MSRAEPPLKYRGHIEEAKSPSWVQQSSTPTGSQPGMGFAPGPAGLGCSVCLGQAWLHASGTAGTGPSLLSIKPGPCSRLTRLSLKSLFVLISALARFSVAYPDGAFVHLDLVTWSELTKCTSAVFGVGVGICCGPGPGQSSASLEAHGC